MSVLMNPDCRDGKHRACSGVGWDDFPVDEPADCPCECHRPEAKLTTHAMHAKHLSGASIGKLIEWEVGRSIATGEWQWSPAVTLDAIYHSGHEHTIYDTDGNETELPPESWVRVTQNAP